MESILNYFSKKLSLFSGNTDISKNRIHFVFLVFLCLFSIISIRLFFLTVIPKLTVNKSTSVIPYHSVTRRDIVDRNGELLATNLSTASVYANPKVIPNQLDAVNKLKKIFPTLNHKELLTKLRSDKSFIWIKRFITPTEHQLINDAGIPGLYFETGERRAYPYSSLFSHAIGNVGLDGYGLSGIEKYFDHILRYEKSETKKEPLALSLDVKIQSIVKEELQHAISTFNAKGGVGIVQDPNKGELIAIVSLPDFDPYNISEASEDALFNRATLGSYEVGSVLKPVTIASALDSEKININEVYDVNNPIHFASYQIKDFHQKESWLSVPEILMYSSNIGTSQIALELGKNNQFEYLKDLGLLTPTEIEVPEKSTPNYPPFSKWNELNTITISFGHGISISPLHVAKATSSLINGGKVYPTTILKQSEPPRYSRIIKKSTSDIMRKLLRLVVKHGAGKKAELEGYFIGGKTGTANKVIDGKYSKALRVSSFVGAFPIYDPKYVVYVMLDEPKSTKETFGFATGGWTAAPTAGKIIKRISTLYNIAPQLNEKEKIENHLHIDYNFRQRAS